jgi:hypothetical protein
MASSKKSSTKSTTGGKKPAPKATASTAVRHSAIPKPEIAAVAAPAPRAITSEMIAHRAYEIWASGAGGSEIENWSRAERELRAA